MVSFHLFLVLMVVFHLAILFLEPLNMMMGCLYSVFIGGMRELWDGGLHGLWDGKPAWIVLRGPPCGGCGMVVFVGWWTGDACGVCGGGVVFIGWCVCGMLVVFVGFGVCGMVVLVIVVVFVGWWWWW